MRQFFVQTNFRISSLEIIDTANAICAEYAAQGYDLSLRQLYYQFVARGLLDNTEQNYKKLGSIISNARLAGELDWDYIKDRGRNKIENNHWNDPSEILDACAAQFRIDTWKDQENFVIVMVEKQALEGVLVPVCRKLDVAFIANKGYSSSSSMYEIGREMFRAAGQERFPNTIYLGDHDPSGIDMTRDVEERLELFCEGDVAVHRVALNMDQIELYNPPENPAKLSDTRAEKYIHEFGYSSWELDALDPSVLAALVTSKVEELREYDKWKALVEKQQAWRDELAELANQYKN